MSIRVAELQQWLNDRGVTGYLALDGKGGPLTRAAVIEMFRNRQAPAITTPELAMVADGLEASVRQVAAVAKVESAGGGWDDAGLLKCLWERHYLWKRVRFAIPLLSNPKPGGYTVDADRDGINDSWEKLADAACRFGALAFECASFGKFQIMGAHWKALGYSSALDFVWQLSRSELAHYQAFAAYLRAYGLTGALRKVDGNPINAQPLARGYNGEAYAKYGYDVKIAAAWRALR